VPACLKRSGVAKELEDGLADRIQARRGDVREIVAATVEAGEVEIDQVDRRDSGTREWQVIVEHRRRDAGREHLRRADLSRRAA
jgi:hypothetical protein